MYLNLIRGKGEGRDKVRIRNDWLTDGVCETASAPIRSVEGQLRLVTPTVVNMTREHFGCDTEADFGGPLEMKVSQNWKDGIFVCVYVLK